METLKQFIASVLPDPSSRALLLGIAATVLAGIAFLAIVKITRRMLLKILARIESCRGTTIPPLKIQTLEVLSADRLTDLLKQAVKIVRAAALAIVLYIFIPAVMSFFPWSRALVEQYFPYIIAPVSYLFQSFIAFIPSLCFIAVTVVITRYILKFTKILFHEIETGNIAFPGFHVQWAAPTSKLLRFLIAIFAIVLVSPHMPGFGSPAFQGISIFFGVLLSLGSTAAIANIVAGVVITYMRPFNVGDRVKIADTMGDVLEKTLLITRVRTIKNIEVTIPNAMVLGSHMINFSSLAAEKGIILHTAITIGYDIAWRKVHELLLAAARATQGVIAEPAPFVLQTALNDFAVSYELNVTTADPKSLLKTQSELHQHIQDRFNEAGIEIMSPTYAAVRDGNQAVLPEDYLPKTSASGGFRILPLGKIGGMAKG